jgi:hypothetical protein
MSGLPAACRVGDGRCARDRRAIVGRRHVITGPMNTTGLLVLGALPFLGQNGLLRPEGLGWLATLTLLCGALRIVSR